jgi:imidazolonepropionase-like amidohydrolase
MLGRSKNLGLTSAMFYRLPIAATFALLSQHGLAQVSTRPEIEISQAPQRFYALTHARIYVTPSDVRADATLVIEDGRIQAILPAGSALPIGATVLDVMGKTIRPAFIDLASNIATDPAQVCASSSNIGFTAPQDPTAAAEATPGAQASGHWNKLVCPERSVAASLKFDEAKLAVMRKLGFGYALSHGVDGVLRGQSALISLAANASAQQNLISADVSSDAAIEQIFDFSGSYPTSYMGAIALLRQAFIDARWQHQRLSAIGSGHKLERPEANRALDALTPAALGRRVTMWFAKDELDLARAQQIADENRLQLVSVGTGFEYRVVATLNPKTPLIVPLNFPDPPPVSDPEKALDVSLADLEHWRYSPFNPRILTEHNIRFALSATGLQKPEASFAANLRKAIRHGLNQNTAFAALTSVPADMIQAGKIGSLKPGNYASFSVSDENFLSAQDAKIYEMWIDGHREIFQAVDALALEGRWRFTEGANAPAELIIGKELSAQFIAGKSRDLAGVSANTDSSNNTKSDAAKIAFTRDGERILMQLPKTLTSRITDAPSDAALSMDLTLTREVLQGRWLDAHGAAHAIRLTRIGDLIVDASDKLASPDAIAVSAFPTTWRYPAGEFGRSQIAAQNVVLIHNVTAWITDKTGPEKNIDVLIENGRIKAVGAALKAPDRAQIIDGTGKHLSPGLIDAHSHIAASGNVNEGSHAVTSEVRVGDIIDPTDINIYRELAGGTTTSQVLHGSANPIGGQAQVIKHRWGLGAEALKFAGVMPTIKFALGENPKQANWGDAFQSRYPQTRMGVEAIIRAQFTQARAYGAALKADANTRRDLRLEPLWEILQGKRLVHIHSYRGDEILMFVRLSHEFGFKIGAFQHVLEGYKVAQEINEVDAGASTFADWWGYKVEVIDAIPNNAALMLRQGVNVSLNSDSQDLGRRLNTEAAKSVRYGNLSETEALKLVTLNPAKQLRIDSEVGSIEVGKSADLVLWNRPPLSTLARPETVWIDGRVYFDHATEEQELSRVEADRAALIQFALPELVQMLKHKSDDEKLAPDLAKPDLAKPMIGLAQTWHTTKHWPSIWMAKRGLYHNGEASHFCTDGE